MPIDASIALGVKPMPIESPINQMAKMYEMQNAVQSNQLNQMKMDEYKRGLAEQEQFKNALVGSQDETGIKNAFYSLGEKGVKGYQDYLKTKQETTNLGFTGKEVEGKVAKQKQDFIAQAFRNISQNPSDQNVIAWGQDAVLNKHFTLEEANGIVNTLLSQPAEQRSAFLASQGASASDLKPTIQTQGLGNVSNIVSVPAFGGAPTQLSSSTIGQSPDSVASNARIASEGRLNRENAKEVAKLRNSGDLTPEQNDALYGANGAVTTGKLDPYKVNSRNSHILANAYLSNPNTDMNKLASDAAMMRNAPTMNRAYTTEQLPTIISNVVDAGKKVNYSDAKFFGKVEEFINGQSNDPNFINYMTQRNDALLTITSIMRGNGATDQAHRAEIEASPSTMSPKAFDAWAAGQMKALEPRIKQANKFTRTQPAPTAATSAPAAKPTLPLKNNQGWILHTDVEGNKAYVSSDGQIKEVK